MKNAVKVGGKQALPPTLKLAAALPEHGRGKPLRQKDFKDEVRIVAYIKQDGGTQQ